jgi:acetyl-CoA synthetase
LLNGITSVIFEGVMDYPKPDRIWKVVDKYKITVLYTAPTVVRMLMAYGDKWLKTSKRDSLVVLGTVGEPIDKDAWNWYFKKAGKSRCPIIDTWWQTETGGTLINSLPGLGPFIPCYAALSFPGTKHIIVDEQGKEVKQGKTGYLVQASPFAPGMLRGVWKNPKRYKKTYWDKFDMYLTGDYAFQDKEGYFRITGRSDDVIKVAGHRLSTAEMEDAMNSHPDVHESAVVSRPDKIKGEVPVAFIVRTKKEVSAEELQKIVRTKISPIASISEFYFVDDLPKTRSGKIMRRVLKNLLRGEELKDLSTMINPESIKAIKKILKV